MQKINLDVSALSTQFQRETTTNRVETGALQFNDDWPGVFIRGDNAMHYKIRLQHLIAMVENPGKYPVDLFTIITAKNLVDLLESCAIIPEHNEDDDNGVGC